MLYLSFRQIQPIKQKSPQNASLCSSWTDWRRWFEYFDYCCKQHKNRKYRNLVIIIQQRNNLHYRHRIEKNQKLQKQLSTKICIHFAKKKCFSKLHTIFVLLIANNNQPHNEWLIVFCSWSGYLNHQQK